MDSGLKVDRVPGEMEGQFEIDIELVGLPGGVLPESQPIG
jgi:hypothetical protein